MSPCGLGGGQTSTGGPLTDFRRRRRNPSASSGRVLPLPQARGRSAGRWGRGLGCVQAVGRMCSVLGAMCSVFWRMCSVSGPMCSVFGRMCSLLRAMCPDFGSMCQLFGRMCPVFGLMCSLWRGMCPVWRAMCPVVRARCSGFADAGLAPTPPSGHGARLPPHTHDSRGRAGQTAGLRGGGLGGLGMVGCSGCTMRWGRWLPLGPGRGRRGGRLHGSFWAPGVAVRHGGPKTLDRLTTNGGCGAECGRRRGLPLL